MNLAEIIYQRLKDIDTIFHEAGEWTGEEYMEMVMPLHKALLILAEDKYDKSGSMVEE